MDKQKFYNDLREEEQKLLKEEQVINAQLKVIDDKIKALQVLLQYYNADNQSTDKVVEDYRESKPAAIVKVHAKSKKSYKKRTALTVPGMVLNSLDAIGRGASADIANKMVQLYPSVPHEKASKDTKHHLSLLSKAGKVRILEKRPGKLGFIYQSSSDFLVNYKQ